MHIDDGNKSVLYILHAPLQIPVKADRNGSDNILYNLKHINSKSLSHLVEE